MKIILSNLILVVALLVFIPPIVSASMHGTMDVSFQESDSVSDGVSSKSTILTKGLSLGLSAKLTKTISIAGDVRHTVMKTNGDESDKTFPQFTLTYHPPTLSRFSFGYTRTEVAPSNGIRLTATNLNTSYSQPLVDESSLLLYLNRSTSQDYETPHRTDSISTRYGLSLGHGWTFLETDANLQYSFSQSNQKDNVANEKREMPLHQVSADASKSFLDNKVNTRVNLGYTFMETTLISLDEPSRFDAVQPTVAGLYAFDTTAAIGILTNTPTLINGDNVAPVLDVSSTPIDLRNAGSNIGFQLRESIRLHEIHLYVQTADTNIDTYSPTAYNWRLYTSNDGEIWTQHYTSGVYDSTLSRFRFTFTDMEALYFKVVNDSPAPTSSALNITEIEAVGYRLEIAAQSVSDDTARYFGGLSVNVNATSKLNIGYSLNYNKSDQSANNSFSSSLNHGMNLTFLAIPKYLTVSSSYTIVESDTSQHLQGQERTTSTSGTDSFSLVFASSPLPTVNANLNYSHVENVSDGAKTTTSDTVDTSVFMKLYTGIDVSLGVSLNSSNNALSSSNSEAFSQYTNLSLSPLSYLNATVNAMRSSSETENDGVTTKATSKTLSTSISFSPTRKFYLSASFSIEPVASQSYSMSWMPTSTIQANLTHGMSESYESSGGSVSWMPFGHLSTYMGYNVSESKRDAGNRSESVYARASLRF